MHDYCSTIRHVLNFVDQYMENRQTECAGLGECTDLTDRAGLLVIRTVLLIYLHAKAITFILETGRNCTLLAFSWLIRYIFWSFTVLTFHFPCIALLLTLLSHVRSHMKNDTVHTCTPNYLLVHFACTAPLWLQIPCAILLAQQASIVLQRALSVRTISL